MIAALRRQFFWKTEAMLLLIDNYDSFTFNLVHYFGEVGAEVVVHRNTEISVAQALSSRPSGIVISPGPATPDKAGICLDLIAGAAEARIPVLGVCLGHQAIGQAFGGQVVRAGEIVHGKVRQIRHVGTGLFAGLAQPLNATRYHSLIVDRDTLPACLTITADLDDGTIMGLSHTSLPIHGVQFHPESIRSKHGHALLRNFVQMTTVPA